MKRVKKNKGIYKKNKKGFGKRILIWIIRNVGLFIIGLTYIIYSLLKWFNNLVVKVFMRLPKLIRVAIIYGLVICSLYGVYNSNNEVIINQEIIKVNFTEGDAKILREENAALEAELEKIKAENQKQKTISSLGSIENDIYNKSIEVGLTHEQAILVVSISKHETGNWTSNAFINKNNFGGVMCNSGLKVYDTYDDGLTGFVNLLKNRYFDKGLNTIEKIGAVYCPVGASNDPKGLNQYWIPTITQFYNDYLSK